MWDFLAVNVRKNGLFIGDMYKRIFLVNYVRRRKEGNVEIKKYSRLFDPPQRIIMESGGGEIQVREVWNILQISRDVRDVLAKILPGLPWDRYGARCVEDNTVTSDHVSRVYDNPRISICCLLPKTVCKNFHAFLYLSRRTLPRFHVVLPIKIFSFPDRLT